MIIYNGENDISKIRRWAIYLVCLIESIFFGGVIFGFAQLTYVLKKEGVFLDLCRNINNPTDEEKLKGCPEQDEAYAFVYTMGSTIYGVPSVLIGFSLHYFGLGINRICASFLISGGFICLGMATQEAPYWVYSGISLLALGGNQLRLAGLQSADVFKEYRATALAIISGAYSASAGIFLFVQIAAEHGTNMHTSCRILALLAALVIPATLIMPCDRIINRKDDETVTEKHVPLRESLLSVSLGTYFYWYWISMIGLVLFITYFNSWISRISTSDEEAGFYSSLYSIGQFICPFISPLVGFMIDYAIKREKNNKDPIAYRINELKSPFLPLLIVCLIECILYGTLLLSNPLAIYIGIICLIIASPSIVAVGITFIRIRFPADHFHRLIGIIGTIVSLLTMLNYFHFKWSIDDYYTAQIFMLILIISTLVHPLHLLLRPYREKIAKQNIYEDIS